jgi:hypothetical protein
MITINASNVVGDNFWLWRADHGLDDYPTAPGQYHGFNNGNPAIPQDPKGVTLNNSPPAWGVCPSNHGMVVNGDYVSLYGLMTEHHLKAATYWTGNHGKVFMVQTETAYDGCTAADKSKCDAMIAKSQATTGANCQVSGSVEGSPFSGFETGPGVHDLEAYGVNIYSFYYMAGQDGANFTVPTTLGSVYLAEASGDRSNIKLINASSWEIAGGKGRAAFDVTTPDTNFHGNPTKAGQARTFSTLQNNNFTGHSATSW